MKNSNNNYTEEPIRKLSPWRVLFAIFMLTGLSFTSFFGFKFWQEVQSAAAHKSWFAAYVDVTSTPTYDFEQLGETTTKNVVLSFIVSSLKDPCIPSWGAAYDADQARAKFDLDRRIARLRQQDGNIAISFGGLKNDELALKCIDENKLFNAYKSVIERYNVDTIDLDLENNGLKNLEAGKRRAKVIAKLQSQRRAQGKSLAVWLTIPVAPQGLTEDGTNAVSLMLDNKVDLAGVNVMTMDYGASKNSEMSMQIASQKALNETHRQLGILYKNAGINLNSASLWKKIGATPMIGQNDVQEEVFSLEDAEGFNKFSKSHGIGRMSMWSANRDIACGGNYVSVKIVSDSCSGVKQDRLAFSILLSRGFDGNLKSIAKIVTKEDPEAKEIKPDDPAKSPYQVWTEKGAYLQGAKVVWHQNVYEAKWWTQGEMPDNPVLQSWQTAWQLVGPVLPGEKPIKQPTLPKGTYPDWSGTEEYETGDVILFNGIPYKAKWWTLGDSPAAQSSNADSSPWVPFTQEQVNQILEDASKK